MQLLFLVLKPSVFAWKDISICDAAKMWYQGFQGQYQNFVL